MSGLSSRVGQVIALCLGVSLTVGFYEGRRMVMNTSRALSVASTQLSGVNPAAAQKREAVLSAIAEKGGDAAVAKAREERVQAIARRAEQRGTSVDRQRAERLAARLEAWEDLSPEARAAAKERRQARVAAARHPGSRADRPGRPPSAPVGSTPPSEARGVFPEEEGLSPEDEALLEDTALLLEE